MRTCLTVVFTVVMTVLMSVDDVDQTPSDELAAEVMP